MDVWTRPTTRSLGRRLIIGEVVAVKRLVLPVLQTLHQLRTKRYTMHIHLSKGGRA